MRTLLVSAGICLTAGTFIAAERVTASAEQSRVLEHREATQAALDAQAAQENKSFAAKVASLQSAKDNAEAQVTALKSTVEELTNTQDDGADQIAAVQSLQDNLTQLEATNLQLVEGIATKDAELDALNTQIASLSRDLESQSKQALETQELVAEIASLKEQVAAAESATATGDQAGDTNAALVEELQAAKATIDKLTQAAADQATTAEQRIAAISEKLGERNATVVQLQSELAAKAVANAIGAPATTDDGQAPDSDIELSARLSELSELVSTQAKTISNLRMGFEAEPASAMEMASACIDRARKIFEISQIKFGTGTSAISEQSITTLDHLRDLAIGCESEELYIEIGGHTDSKGAESANQALSEARAQSVRDFLVGRGISEDKMIAVGYGEAQPIATNDTPEGRAQNRRITFTWQMREKAADTEETANNIDG